jgi:hypothetical protein
VMRRCRVLGRDLGPEGSWSGVAPKTSLISIRHTNREVRSLGAVTLMGVFFESVA